MSRTPKNAVITELVTTDLTTLAYTIPPSTVTTAYLVVTNNSATTVEVEVYLYDGQDDYLLVSKKIPGGIGKTWRVFELSDQKLNTGQSIKVKQSTANSVNYFLSVSEISDS